MVAQRTPAEQRRWDRFHRRYERREGSSCWWWTGALQRNGYAKFYWDRARIPVWAHRASWELWFGPIPEGMDVCHTCDNRACVRPDHLFLGTRADNMADAKAKGRTTQGERSAQAKLTTEDVLAIRASGELGTVVARRLGVSASLVQRIRRRVRWGHV